MRSQEGFFLFEQGADNKSCLFKKANKWGGKLHRKGRYTHLCLNNISTQMQHSYNKRFKHPLKRLTAATWMKPPGKAEQIFPILSHDFQALVCAASRLINFIAHLAMLLLFPLPFFQSHKYGNMPWLDDVKKCHLKAAASKYRNVDISISTQSPMGPLIFHLKVFTEAFVVCVLAFCTPKNTLKKQQQSNVHKHSGFSLERGRFLIYYPKCGKGRKSDCVTLLLCHSAHVVK